MQVFFKKNIVDDLQNIINESIKTGKDIEHISLTKEEAILLFDMHMQSQTRFITFLDEIIKGNTGCIASFKMDKIHNSRYLGVLLKVEGRW